MCSLQCRRLLDQNLCKATQTKDLDLLLKQYIEDRTAERYIYIDLILDCRGKKLVKIQGHI